MKRKIFLFFIASFIIIPLLHCCIASLFHCSIIVSPVLAVEKINEFKADIVINTDGTINVTENISYYFDTPKHGIYRTIPTVKTNQQGKKFQMDFKLQGVTDETDRAYNYTTAFEGTNLKIKIGDANRTISGVHTYIINYQVSGALTYFSDHDELFWNVTGNEWQVPILQASAVVNLPEQITQEVKTICFTGPTGSKEQLCQSVTLSANTSKIDSSRALNSYEGLTAAISFPKGIVQVLEPKEYQELDLKGLSGSLFAGGIGTIILLIGVLFWYILLPLIVVLWWYLKGRDPNVGKPVTAWYDPPKDKTGRRLTPGEVGTLVDEKVDQKDLTATIVSLAIKGYLTIKEEKKKTLIFENTDYSFIKKKDFENDQTLQEHERLVLNKFFSSRDEVSTKDLTDNFYLTVGKFNKELYQKVVSLGFFPENPNSVRTKYMIFGGLVLFMGGNILLAIVLFIVGYNMPKKTIEGAKANMEALGLKNFLSSQGRQLEFQVKNWFTFEKLLPFAIIFGVEKIWAERFKDLQVTPPDWYQGSYGSTFNTIYFASSLSRSMSSMNAMAMSPSRSSSGFSSGFSGGGSSGGGGGGGGGGSW